MAFSGSLEDRIALRELLDSYADAVCRHDADAWAATWAEGCEWELEGFGTFRGKALVVETWRAAMKGFPGIIFQAWPGEMIVEGDRATMRSYTAETYSRDGHTQNDLGEYTDTCSKIEGRWYFVCRRFRALHRRRGAQ